MFSQKFNVTNIITNFLLEYIYLLRELLPSFLFYCLSHLLFPKKYYELKILNESALFWLGTDAKKRLKLGEFQKTIVEFSARIFRFMDTRKLFSCGTSTLTVCVVLNS